MRVPLLLARSDLGGALALRARAQPAQVRAHLGLVRGEEGLRVGVHLEQQLVCRAALALVRVSVRVRVRVRVRLRVRVRVRLRLGLTLSLSLSVSLS